jgi:2-keto-4-pentenoate hydratase
VNRTDERIIEGMERQRTQLSVDPAGADRVGWKSAFGTEGGMEYLGIEQPLAGFLTRATRLESGTAVDVSGWGVPLIEAEVAVRIDAGLGPGAGADEAAEAIGAVAAAIELIDLGPTESVADVVAGNIFHRRFLVGEFRECSRPDLDELRIAVTANGTGSEPSDPREVIGELGKIVAAIADQAELADDRLRPGDLIITGAAVPPAPLSPGDRYEVEITGGSTVTVGISG